MDSTPAVFIVVLSLTATIISITFIVKAFKAFNAILDIREIVKKNYGTPESGTKLPTREISSEDKARSMRGTM